MDLTKSDPAPVRASLQTDRRSQRNGRDQAAPWYREPRLGLAVSGGHEDTELTTRLTRCKFKRPAVAAADGLRGSLGGVPKSVEAGAKRRTLTRLDQNLLAPIGLSAANKASAHHSLGGGGGGGQNCRFKAQVVFESDTDSAAERQSSLGSLSLYNTDTKRQMLAARQQQRAQQRDNSLANEQASSSNNSKQLITETKYLLTNGSCAKGNGQEEAGGALSGQQHDKKGQLLARGPQPNWEYSLRVNRMRGNKVASKAK